MKHLVKMRNFRKMCVYFCEFTYLSRFFRKISSFLFIFSSNVRENENFQFSPKRCLMIRFLMTTFTEVSTWINFIMLTAFFLNPVPYMTLMLQKSLSSFYGMLASCCTLFMFTSRVLSSFCSDPFIPQYFPFKKIRLFVLYGAVLISVTINQLAYIIVVNKSQI
jgi:hypothetical protein